MAATESKVRQRKLFSISAAEVHNILHSPISKEQLIDLREELKKKHILGINQFHLYPRSWGRLNYGVPASGPILFSAIMRGYTDIVALLLEKGADLTVVDQWQRTALYYALGSNYEMAQLLVEKGINLQTSSIEFSLLIDRAAQEGDTAMVIKLLDELKNSNIDEKRIRNIHTGALYWATKAHKNETAQYILSLNKANLNCTISDGNTPLHLAAAREDVAMIMLLLKLGADITQVNNAGKTPTDLIPSHRNDIKEAVKNKDANPNLSDNPYSFNYTSYIQWLPKELLDDALALPSAPNRKGS